MTNRQRYPYGLRFRTTAGKQFEPYARRWLRLWEETEHAMSGEAVNTLIFTSTSFINAYLMPEIYARLSPSTRSLSFQFLRNNYYECYRLLEERSADIAFVSNLQMSLRFDIGNCLLDF